MIPTIAVPNAAGFTVVIPNDNVIYSREHHRLTRDMEACAWAFVVTGEQKYAQRVRDILVGYAKRYMSI